MTTAPATANKPSTTTRPTVPWDMAILSALGAPTSLNNRTKLWAWTAHELGGDAKTGGWDYVADLPRWNWFDTSLSVPGSADCLSCSQRDIQRYATPADGIAATVRTLLYSSPNFGYGDIVANLRQDGSFQGFSDALAKSCWGGCGWGGYPNFAPVGQDPSSAEAGALPPDPGTSSAATLTAAASSSQASSADCSAAGTNSSTRCCGAPDGGHAALNLGPYHFFYPCQIKATLGGLAMAGGGLLMLVGVVVLARGTSVGRAAGTAVTLVVPGGAARAATRAGKGAPAPAPTGSGSALGAAATKRERDYDSAVAQGRRNADLAGPFPD